LTQRELPTEAATDTRVLSPIRFAAHSYLVQEITTERGWLPAARYTNLRDVRRFERIGFIDIDWQNYSFTKHLQAVKSARPLLTVAKDLDDLSELPRILDQAAELRNWSDAVIFVPKVDEFKYEMEEVVPLDFIFGYSTPTQYGGTSIEPKYFHRPTHILGGSPQAQLALGSQLDVCSFDCNRFTLDARYGDFFDGVRFRPHPTGGYRACLKASVESINRAWDSLSVPASAAAA